MSSTLNASCLSFFTANHSSHAKQWLQKGSRFPLVCFACLVEIIENKTEASIKKTRTLQEILKLITNGGVLGLLAENEAVLSHLLKCLWELMNPTEANVQHITAIEIVFQLSCVLKSESFVEKVVEQLIMKIVSAENVKKVSPQLNLLGKLLQNIPALSRNVVRHRSNVVSFLGKWTSYPDEDTRSALFFVLTHFYRFPESCAAIPWEITELVFRECCEVLTGATSKDLQINSIALLQSLTTKENFSTMSKAITSNIDRVITSLKKAFLSSVELVQTIAIGCLNNLVQFDESIVSCDLPGFIFEVFHSKSDTLLSLGLLSVSQLLEKKEMYTKGHVVYGFDTMLSTLLAATECRNMKILRQGFEVLRKIFERCPQELALISNQELLLKCLDVIMKGLSALDDGVVLSVISCLGVVLELRHYGCDVAYKKLVELLGMVVGRLEKVCHDSGHWSRVENKNLKSSTIAAILEVLNKSLDLVITGRSKPPSIEVLLASTELEDFMNNLLKLCDQICIPIVVANLRNLQTTAVPEIFFQVLNKLLKSASADCKAMSQKFVSSCFIRIALETRAQHLAEPSVQEAVNAFLETICCLLPSDMREHAQNLLSLSLHRVNGTAQELLQILKQTSTQDETLRSTQECILILFYLAYSNGDRLTPRAQILHALCTYLVHNPTLCYSSIVTQRCVTQLFITELYRGSKPLDSSPLYGKAQQVLAEGLRRNMNTLRFLYFHQLSLLEWAVVFPDLNPEVRREIMELWFSQGCEDISKEEMLFWKRMMDENRRTLLMLVSLVSKAEVHAQNRLLQVLGHVLQSCNLEAMKPTLQELKQALQKLFLNQAVEPLPKENMASVLKLLCLMVTCCTKEALDEDYIKLVYHVVNFLTHHASSSELCVRSLNFLNACMVQDTKYGCEKVFSFMLNHREYNSFLEKAIEDLHNSTELERSQESSILAAVLVSISHLLHLQNTFGISTKIALRVRMEVVLPLLTHSSNPLLQFAANVFWESVLTCLESSENFDSNLVLLSENSGCDGTRSGRNITKLHLRMILVYLQNSLLHVNPFIKFTALRCLEALFEVKEHARELIQDPWNTVMLRECKDLSSLSSLGFTMELYALFLHHKRSKSLTMDLALKDLIAKALEQTFCDVSPSALVKLFSEVLQDTPDLMTEAEKSSLKDRMEQLIEDHHNKEGQFQSGFLHLQDLLVHDELIQGKPKNLQNSFKELLAKLEHS